MASLSLGSITTTAAQDTALLRQLNKQNTQNPPAVTAGGSGYTVGDVLTAVGGTFTTAMQFTVTAAAAGVVTAVSLSLVGVYSVRPASPLSVTGGTGTGATFTMQYDDIVPMLRGLLAILVIQDARRQYLADIQDTLRNALTTATATQLANAASALGVTLPS